MPVIDLSNEAESSPEAGPSSLRHVEQDPNDSVVLLRDTDTSTAGHRRKRRRLASHSNQDQNDTDDDDDVQVVNNSQPISSSNNARRRGQSAGGLPLHLPSRPNGTFVNLADDSLAPDDNDYVQPFTSFSAGPRRSLRSNDHLDLDDQERSLAGGALASVYATARRTWDRFRNQGQSAAAADAILNNNNNNRNTNRLNVFEDAPSRYPRATDPSRRPVTRGGLFRDGVPARSSSSAAGNRQRPPPNSQAAHTQAWGDFYTVSPHPIQPLPAGIGLPFDFVGNVAVQDIIRGLTSSPATAAPTSAAASYADAASRLPEPKFDATKSHPGKLERGFRRDVVPPSEVINVDMSMQDDDDEDEYEEVPICAACDTELFVPESEGDKSVASRPCALKCGHVICAACTQAQRSHYRSHVMRVSREKKRKGAHIAPEAEQHGIKESVTPAMIKEGKWLGCPVEGCDGAGTQPLRAMGHPDGMWQIYINVE